MMRYFSSYKVTIKVIEYKKTGLQVSKIAGHLVGKSQEVNNIQPAKSIRRLPSNVYWLSMAFVIALNTM